MPDNLNKTKYIRTFLSFLYPPFLSIWLYHRSTVLLLFPVVDVSSSHLFLRTWFGAQSAPRRLLSCFAPVLVLKPRIPPGSTP